MVVSQIKKSSDVLVVGELNMDLILSGIEGVPALGREIISHEMEFTIGSSSAIFASNLATLGTDVSFIGRVGNDSFGEQVITSLRAKGVNTDGILRSKINKTGVTVVLSYDNERANVTYPGAMAELNPNDISDQTLQTFRHLHVSSLFMQPNLQKDIIPLFKRAKNIRLTTSLDTQWDPEEKWNVDWKHLLPLVDFFMPNLDELKSITQQTGLKESVHKIADYANVIVVKDNVNGSVLWQNGMFRHQKAYVNTMVMDTTGAGDSFNAGFIHQYLRNRPFEECLEFGAICGAINTTRHGGTTAFTSRDDIKRIASTVFNYQIHDL